MCSLRQRVAAWDSIREWESRQAPKCHTSSWILVLLALECLCLTEVALTRTMTVYHHVQTLLWMLKSICARSPASETDSLPELLSRSAATAVVASSGSPWPQCPSWWPSPIPFLLMCTQVGITRHLMRHQPRIWNEQNWLKFRTSVPQGGFDVSSSFLLWTKVWNKICLPYIESIVRILVWTV